MKCPKCDNEMRELNTYLHHLICDKCKYEEEDIFIKNEGKYNLTLLEAIGHAEEIAKSECSECSKEHEQLAIWLRELYRYRESDL